MFLLLMVFFFANFKPFRVSTFKSIIPYEATISSAPFANITFSEYSLGRLFYDSVSRPISTKKDRFCTNDPPTEGTGNPAYI